MEKNIIFKAVEEFLSKYNGEKIIIYGGGRCGELLCYVLEAYGLDVAYFVDGNTKKQGSYINKVEIRSPYDILYEDCDNIIVLIGLNDSEQPKKFLEENGIRYCQLYTAHTNRKADLLDPFLGYTRIDDIEGFKILGEENPEISIVTLGGSTTDWSYGKFNSWPFYLYQNYVKSGIRCKIYNGGIIGYYSGQELLKLLRDGLGLSPDIVICYSGMNDAININRAKDYSLISSYLKNAMDSLSVSRETRFGLQQEISDADNWIKNMRLMNAMCKEFEISFYSFLQPNAYIGNYIMTDREKIVFEKFNRNSEMQSSFYNYLIDKIKDYSYIYDFTDIFSNQSGIYYDSCHVSEEGNQIIANRIYECINY